MADSLCFGAELRRLRHGAGMTLDQVAAEVNYSSGHLCKVELGDKKPTMTLARRCDALFGTDGRLGRLVESAKYPAAGTRASPRALLALEGSALAPGTDMRETVATKSYEATLPLVALFQERLELMRKLGQASAPDLLLGVLREQVTEITGLAVRASGRTRAELLVIAARFAEYIGWMAQEAGDEAGALRWTAEAVELAEAGGDVHLADYAQVRRALVTMYAGAAAETVALAQQAQRSTAPPRIRGLACQRAAQGYALLGDEKACLMGLDRARTPLDDSEPDGPVLGPTNLTDPVAMVFGWCLHDLGRHRQAAEVLDRECALIPPHALRSRVRYGVRRALAHAAAGAVERSCEVARELLDCARLAPSATVRADVRRLDRELLRFRTSPMVRDLRPALTEFFSVR
ncbi:helix-turn-helix domain-containing protein [Streptomyces bauhiniae]|uniref:helix-turn-helix domain-containing protein n=1 Tax=Streptomyces bauhiniae TaxID=2340725 RepID=UPI0035DDB5A5